ncbi:Molybdopterin oxidoreductase [Sporomusa malonica]|uniref:Molybdopterin oxidoreductase n=1 Tax=Sporomusa malonica TaxID=112901 RepID=A0A1W1YGE5_9FIRM|nr:Molybdopterin oxidoreductase [Sporomusa malonica]
MKERIMKEGEKSSQCIDNVEIRMIRFNDEGGNCEMTLSRRQFIKLSVSTVTVLSASLPFEAEKARAAGYDLKLRDAKENPSICHFCAGGCGLIVHVRDGKVINIEGDPDNPTNKGSLCPKALACIQVRENPVRPLKPLYRAPGAKEWQPISWDEAIERIAQKIKEVRDTTWINDGTNRTDALGMLGSAEVDNEESYLLTKFMRTMGSTYIEHQARI